MTIIYITYATGLLSNKIVEQSIKAWFHVDDASAYIKSMNKTKTENIVFKIKALSIEKF